MIDFLVLGAEKSGTTWLADMLRQHPQIFIPAQKELFYFNAQFFESPELDNYNHSLPLSWYLAHFEGAEAGQLRAEASPAYIWDPAASQAIHAFNAALKLIVLLRDPVERAFSQYRYYIQRGTLSDLSFESALEQRPDLISRGQYAEQLARYTALFPEDQLFIGFFDDIQQDNRALLLSVHNFLALEPHIPQNIDARSNVTGAPRIAWINRALAALRYPLRKYNPGWLMAILRKSGLAALQEKVRLANTQPTQSNKADLQVNAETRQRLIQTFLADIEQLEALTGRDLANWKR
jgi:hypothetical protein